MIIWLFLAVFSCQAEIIWSDLGATLAHETGPGTDILGGSVHREESSRGVLYFKFHVNPISDAGTEDYFAAFELYQNNTERLAVGNALKAWAYGAFNVEEGNKTNLNIFEAGNTNLIAADFGLDLHSAKPFYGDGRTNYEYELPRKGIERTIVFKVEYLPGAKDAVTVWLDPDLSARATESNQWPRLTTTFSADASFNQIRLRHGGGGGGWIFSEMAIATSFADFVVDEPGVGPAADVASGGQLPFAFRVWQRGQGLPQNFVGALAQTKDGYIWAGSDAGVTRFDGLRFVSFGLLEGFQAGPVRTLLGAKDGSLWIGAIGGGLGRWKDKQFTRFTTGLPSETVNALAEDAQGRIWIGTENGLVVWQDGRLQPIPGAEELAGAAITCLFAGLDGSMWMGARQRGVFQLSGSKLTAVADPVFDSLLRDSHCLLVDHEGRVWIGAGESSLLNRENGQWRQYRFPRHLARNYVSAVVEDATGTVWAGSVSDGLFRFQHGKLVAVNASSGLSDNLIEALLVDREGKLWVGTHEGLNRIRPKNLSVISYREGLGQGTVQGLAEIAPGQIWASKGADGLYLWNDHYFRGLAVPELFSEHGECGVLLRDQDGSCWMGGARGLLHFTHPNNAEAEAGQPDLTNKEISVLAQDIKGRLWAGSRQGEVFVRNQGQWSQQTNAPAIHAITAIVCATDGSAWVGTAGEGLFHVMGSVPNSWQKQIGLLSEWVRTLDLDGSGRLWIGTGGGGLSMLKGAAVFTFTTREGLPENTVSQILEDGRGNLWLGGDRGIAAISTNELSLVAEKKSGTLYPQLYGRSEGMLSEECLSGTFPLSLRSQGGALWFPTQEGIVVVDPRQASPVSSTPTVVMEETLVDGVPAASDPLQVGAGKHRLEFRYTGLNFDNPEGVRFRYRLLGLDSDWVEAGSSRTASFPYVPYGNYRFEVVARNGEQQANARETSAEITIARFFWQTWWFRIPATLTLLALIALSARLLEKRKLHRRLEQLEQEKAVAHERERIARDLHDDLGSSLARISLLSGLLKADRDDPSQVEINAGKISQSADQTVRALEEIVWAVRPGSDSVQSLVEYMAHFAGELFEGTAIRCRLDLPHDLPAYRLPPEVRHNIFLIVKEALTNALKHAEAREVTLRASTVGGILEIIVQDDGLGFNPAQRRPGNGLENMRRRAGALGETVVVESKPGQGTAVKLTFRFASLQNSGQAA